MVSLYTYGPVPRTRLTFRTDDTTCLSRTDVQRNADGAFRVACTKFRDPGTSSWARWVLFNAVKRIHACM